MTVALKNFQTTVELLSTFTKQTFQALSKAQKNLTLLLCTAASVVGVGTSVADDTEIFFNSAHQPPNVMFIIDLSGSMNWTDDSSLPDLPGNVLWLDGGDRSTIYDADGDSANSHYFSGKVARWGDKSGHGHDLIGTSATLDNINNRPTVRFTDDIMTGPDIFDGTASEATIFFVSQENVSSNNTLLNFNGNNLYSTGRFSFHTPWSNRKWYWDAGDSHTHRNRSLIARPMEIGSVSQVTAYKSVSENKNGFSLNYGESSATSKKANSTPTSGGLYFGRAAKDHELAELIVYNRKLSDSEIQLVEQHLSQKWSTRLTRAKKALTTLFESAEGFNAGLMTFSSLSSRRLLHNEINPVTDAKASLIQNVNSLTAEGGTPTQDAMYAGMRYFRGEPAARMGGIQVSGPPTLIGDCQSNHIVLLTDGDPYPGAELPEIGNNIGSNCATNQGSNISRGNCGIELAKFMYETDHYSQVAGLNNISTHTIGLSLDMQWLDDIASAGGGGYYSVKSSKQLLKAFEAITEVAIDQGNTFVAPSVSIDQFSRLSHRNEAFLALFQPGRKVRWPGNLKRYKFAGDPPAILDSNNNKAIENGKFNPDAHSFWSLEADGANVREGGAASKLDVTSRKVTTFTNTGTKALLDAKNLVHEDNSSRIESWTNLSGTSLKRMLAWARGVDVDDEDNDQSTTDTRHHIGSVLHSKPQIVTYGGTTDNPDSVVFFGTNEGYLHAIDSDDGNELFSFIPPELLANLEEFHENNLSTERPHGLDGDITLWLDDKNNNGIVDANTEHAYLYAGMRRGGNNYYALDITQKNNPKMLWTIKGGSGDFEELGQTWSKPSVSKIVLDGAEKEVLIFGGGYDESQDTKTSRSSDTIGNTVFIVDAMDGSLIWKTSMDTDSDYTNMQYSIPSDLNLFDYHGDGFVDQIYFGDMGGQLWRLDINPAASSAASLIKGGMIADLAGSNTQNNRRFFYPPDLALTSHSNAVFLSVAIGSGNRAHPLGKNVDNRFYMIRQSAFNQAPEGYGMKSSPASGNTSATYRAITESDLYDATDNAIENIDNAIAMEANNQLLSAQGWHLNLKKSGEKVLGTSLTIDNKIIFTSYVPGSDIGVCSTSDGYNRAYVVNLFNATPVQGPDPDSRWSNLDVKGIAGSVRAFIKGHDEDGNETSVTPVTGLETLEFPKVDVTRRVFWSEYPNF